MPTRGVLGQSRVSRVVAYLLTIAAGAILPAQLRLFSADTEWLWLLMCAWLILGGALSGVGQITRRWTGEFTGLPLISSALTGFGILQGNLLEWNPSVWPSVALLWAFGLVFFARWRDVSVLYRAAREATL